MRAYAQRVKRGGPHARLVCSPHIWAWDQAPLLKGSAPGTRSTADAICINYTKMMH